MKRIPGKAVDCPLKLGALRSRRIRSILEIVRHSQDNPKKDNTMEIRKKIFSMTKWIDQ